MAFNPFFDNIRQNIELGGGRGSGEGIPLQLPRRVRRRIGELPFEWLRVIGRKCGSLDDSEDSDSDNAERTNREENVSSSKLNGPRATSGDEGRARVSKNLRRKPNRRDSRQPNITSSSSESHSPPPDSSSVSYSASTSKVNSKAGSVSPPPQSFEPFTSSVSPPSIPPTSSADLLQGTRTPACDNETSSEDLTKALAMQFYKIELGEQRRLMGVMEHHSKESTTVPSFSSASTMQSSQSGGPRGYAGINVLPSLQSGSTERNSPNDDNNSSAAIPRSDTGCFLPPVASIPVGGVGEEGVREVMTKAVFPYSITAGVEKGEKNRRVSRKCAIKYVIDHHRLHRYRNIWPFEHTRVRLRKSRPEDDDYMNASYVQPLGTKKRYIATQGPLPATFTDFWT
jgi:tyrosine-protein phosphatase 2/3